MGNKVSRVCNGILEASTKTLISYDLQEVALPGDISVEDKTQLEQCRQLVEKKLYERFVNRFIRSLRRHEEIDPSKHEWKRDIGSAYRPENRIEVTDARIRNELRYKGNYKSKHPVNVTDGEDISEIMLSLSSEEEKSVKVEVIYASDRVGSYRQKRVEQDSNDVEEERKRTGITLSPKLIYSFFPY